ncbi:MAG TPA: dihydroorotate dehydrogenase [Spirochaetota bacterium]|nr:dihydroorotate dehydrogenase [Spirochaetota bacterium]HNU91194.1 dihydroorotate dehydrogenase [Spirochaetota bacterium]HPI15020.1 dihydroorotate dehydrogenase [Spirochaetota bacterium]HPO44752.1 dihydroorotate dehydrogenase [Spirochaetota bacterium]HPV97555.1 dihydroorotate dehydrogenase [Spirochaetota bacterium]
MDTSVKIGGLRLKTPVTVASGTAGYGEELSGYYDIARLGAIFTKGLSIEPRRGNRGPRVLETPSGMLNSIGLENVGLNVFLAQKLPFLLERGATVIPNIAGHSVDENVELCRVLGGTEGIAALELNVSCPNVKEGGMAFGRNLSTFSALVSAVRKATLAPLIVKLSPNVTDVAEFARAAKDCGADAVSAVNTFLGMKIDTATGRPHFQNRVAGLSGPAIRPLALRIVYEIFEKVEIPIIGIGGIGSLEDMLEFLMAGASAVSIGTMGMVNPRAAIECVEGFEAYLRERGIAAAAELVGAAHRS